MAERLNPAIPDLEARDSSPASRIVSLHKKLYSTLSLLTQVSNWVPATYSWGVNLRWTTIPLRGSSNTPGRTSCQGNRDKLQPFMPLLLLPLSVVAEYLV